MLSKLSLWIRSNIRRRSAILIVAVMTVLLGIFIFIDIESQRNATEQALLSKGKMMAITGSLAVQHIFEDAISSGRLSEEQVFDTNYILIPYTDPPKYHTEYDQFTDQNVQSIEDGYLLDPDITFAGITDINGYLPTHNSIYSQPMTGDKAIDLIGNRTKRIFNDTTGINAARNTEPYLQQIYHRDTGEVVWDISAPIFVNGRHWGTFRIGISLKQVNAQLAASTSRVFLAAFFLLLGIMIASYLVTRPMILINDLSQLADKVAIGDASELSQIQRVDEIGVLGNAFNHIIAYHRTMAEAVERISEGDLSVEIAPKSENDVLGHAFTKMVENLRQNIKALEKERYLLQTLIDSSADMIYFKDQKSRFIRISQSQANRFGLSNASQAEGKMDFDFFSKKHAQLAYADEQIIIQTGKPIIDKEEEEIWPDGHSTWVSSTKMPFKNEDGEIIGTFGISRDITEHKIMENELRASHTIMTHEIEQRIKMQELLNTEKEILNTTLMSINEGVIATDNEGLITFFNRTAEKITGFSNTEALDRPIESVFTILNPDSEENIQHIIHYLYEMDEIQNKTLNYSSPILVTKSGEKLLAKGSISTIYTDKKNIAGHVIVFQDVTQKQKLETQSALSQKMESIGQMASGIAHEINTPIQYVGDNLRYLNRSFAKIINTIDVYQQWLTDHIDKIFSKEDLDSLTTSTDARRVNLYKTESPVAIEESLAGVDRVRKIVLAMREFSHPSQKEKSFSDINHGIETTITISRNEWKYVADLETDLHPDLPLVNCQIDEINQVILNMIVNSGQAIKEVASDNPEQKGKISVTTRKHADWVHITIQDTGPGIPEAIKGRIFDPFFTTKGIGKGTGQGLYLAHNIIVNKHAGRISVDSHKGEGTTFLIELPIDVPGDGKENA